MTHTILRLPAVKTRTGLSRSTIYLRVSQGKFPKPVSLGGRAVAPVSKEAALRAAAWCEYLEAHARRCYGLLKDDGLRAAQALAAN